MPYTVKNCCHVYHQYTIAAKDRDRLQSYLKAQGVHTTVYYPLALHMQPVFSNLGYKPGDFPHSEQAANQVLSLPMFPELKGMKSKGQQL
ncbi:DegT/DnrJ/EryC1/StrS family aminotransferase [Syntrophaceticus schinkii]